MPRRDIEWIESGCAEGMEALDYQFALGKPRARRIAPPGRLNLILERLRFYGVKRNRWRRAWMRWKIVLRVRATDFLSSTRGRFS